ncbi:MAG: HlyD family secretion protein [Candidatus Schmidhempelia sp.]|nr:HlyD family secretion protein [Candidatus Schmidhempelia sp.]
MSNENSLFRQEAVNSRRQHWQGKVLLLSGIPAKYYFMFLCLFFIVFLCFIFFGNYTRRISVFGEVITYPHPINIFAQQSGYITDTYVSVGDKIKKGQAIYRLNVAVEGKDGKVSDKTTEAIDKQCQTIDTIITRLQQNKNETLMVLNKQLEQYQIAYEETQAIVEKARVGMEKMYEDMQGYEKYQHEGLITKDQLNNQIYSYYQYLASYQSLNSQAIEQKIQLEQLKSQILIQSAELDNQIAEYEVQRDTLLKEQIVSDANDSIVIVAPTDGKIESLSVTMGQMVNTGTSLLQIQPLGNITYSVVIWLPNSSLPYVSIGDSLNIRYAAFPVEKYGQFAGKITAISQIPVSPAEMSNYRSAPSNNSNESYYKVSVALNHQFVYDGKRQLNLSNGLVVNSTVFLDKRPLYQWIFHPVYTIKNSIGGPIQ